MADFSIDQKRLPGVKEGKFGFMQPTSERGMNLMISGVFEVSVSCINCDQAMISSLGICLHQIRSSTIAM